MSISKKIRALRPLLTEKERITFKNKMSMLRHSIDAYLAISIFGREAFRLNSGFYADCFLIVDLARIAETFGRRERENRESYGDAAGSGAKRYILVQQNTKTLKIC